MLVFWLAFRRASIIPTKLQSAAELAYLFVRDEIVYRQLGPTLGKKYFPVICALFFGIFFMNITGIIPGLNISPNANIAMPIFLALIAYVLFIYAGFKEVGGWKFLRNSLFPSGVPWYLYPLLAPIELVNIFIVRPVALALRLFLNFLVGHLLLILAFSATWYFFSQSGALAAIGAVTLLGGLFMTAIEILVSFLQAYVFVLLTTLYLRFAVSEH